MRSNRRALLVLWPGQHKVGPLAETGDARICTRCLELCEEIIEQLSSG